MIFRLLFTVMISVIGGMQLYAQPMSTIIKTQAIEMGRALVNNDLPGFRKFMHPDIIKEAGGAEQMKMISDSAMSMFKQIGGSIKRISYGNPATIVTYKKELQTTLPQTMYITTSFADIEMESTLVAISRDKGENWYFIDTQLYRNEQAKKKMPLLSPDLVIPPPSKPRMIPKEQ